MQQRLSPQRSKKTTGSAAWLLLATGVCLVGAAELARRFGGPSLNGLPVAMD